MQPAFAVELTPQSARLARELKITGLLDKINLLQQQSSNPTMSAVSNSTTTGLPNSPPSGVPISPPIGTSKAPSNVSSMELLSLVQRLDYKLTVVSLQIEDVLSAIDDEDTRADELRFVLENKRDKALKLNSLANLLGSGALATLGASLGVGNNTLGNIVSSAAGGVNTGIAGLAIKEQRDASTSVKHQGSHPNMLAMIFGFEPDEKSKFPDTVWNYLNEPEHVEDTGSVREALIDSWVRLGRIPSPTQPAGKREAALIAGVVSEQHNLSISILDDRSAMLSDLRAAVSRMKRHLLELMLSLQPEE